MEFHSGIPVYKQIMHHVQAAVANGQLEEGDQLPTIRALHEKLNVNPNTVARAYRELGHLRCVATRLSVNQKEGDVTYRGFFVVEVLGTADFPSDERFERRVCIQRDMNELIRSHYVEFRREYMEVLDLFVLELHKAAAQATSGA